jgi:hypothetical protein
VRIEEEEIGEGSQGIAYIVERVPDKKRFVLKINSNPKHT